MPLKFEPLPEPANRAASRRPSKHQRAAAALRGRPGEWASVTTCSNPESAASTATGIKTARLRAYEPAGAFEAHARTVGRQHRVYARFVGAQ